VRGWKQVYLLGERRSAELIAERMLAGVQYRVENVKRDAGTGLPHPP